MWHFGYTAFVILSFSEGFCHRFLEEFSKLAIANSVAMDVFEGETGRPAYLKYDDVLLVTLEVATGWK